MFQQRPDRFVLSVESAPVRLSDTCAKKVATMSNTIEVLQGLEISHEAAEEVGSDLEEPLGIIKDHTYDGRYFLVRWHDDE